MGKQIRFYLDRDTEQRFLEFIISCNGKIMFEGENKKPVSIIKLPEPFSEKGWFKLYLFKEDFGELILKDLPNNRCYINSTVSPVIEFIRTIVDEKDKEIRIGRLWIQMKYWNDQEELVTKMTELDKWYGMLNKWIKKNVIKIEETIKDYKYVDYISPSLKELKEIGYKLKK